MAQPTKRTNQTFHPIINDSGFSVIVGGNAQECFESIDTALGEGAQIGGDNTFSGVNSFTNASFSLTNLPTYATNAAAVLGGLAVNQVYKTLTGELRIVV